MGQRREPSQNRLAALLTAGLLAAAPARALDAIDMALEDLLKVNIVSAPKFAENPDQIPSVVSILTAEDIRLYGWQTLGAALRSLQGFNVTDNHTHAYGGVRGISQPGDSRPRLQILIDGQSINENIYASAPVTSAFHRKDAEAQRKSQRATEKVQKLGITCQVKAFLCVPPPPLRLFAPSRLCGESFFSRPVRSVR